ncbi:MAG TPA: hypothetical protein VH000_10225 [Rhizomicrobium sp.]|nr:hypothetical protein [Rhizomicrobium sp.]
MSTYLSESDGEAGSGLFTLAAIAGAVFVLMSAFYNGAPAPAAAQQASTQQVEQVVVTATAPGHAS